MVRSPALRPAVLLVWLAACPPPDSGADAGDPFPRQQVAVQCHNSVPSSGFRVFPGEPDLWIADVRGEGLTRAALLTADRGRTFQHIPVDYSDSMSGAFENSFYTADPERHYLFSRDFWATQAIAGWTINFNVPIDPQGNLLWLGVVVRGEGKLLESVGSSAVMTDGTRATRVWKATANEWIFRAGPWLHATRDAGRTTQRIGAAWLTHIAGSGDVLAQTTLGDTIFSVSRGDVGVFFRSERGQPPERMVDLPLGGKDSDVAPHSGQRLLAWGERLVLTAPGELWVSEDTHRWTRLTLGAGEKNSFDPVVDAEGNLWAFPNNGESLPFRVYRFAPGASTPVLMELDGAGAPLSFVRTPNLLPDGRLAFLGGIGPTRELRGTLFCELGPGVTAGFDRVAQEPLDGVRSGRMIVAARFQDVSHVNDKLAVAPSGQLYASQAGRGALRAHAPGTEPIWDNEAEYMGVANPEWGLIPGAVFGATDRGVSAMLHSPSSLTVDPPKTNRRTFEAATGQTLARAPLGPYRAVFALDELMGHELHRTSRGTFLGEYLAPVPPLLAPISSFSNRMVTSGAFGFVVSNLDFEFPLPRPGPHWVQRFDPVSERVPHEDACKLVPTPAGCIAQPPRLAPIAARVDGAGNLFLLDVTMGSVWMLPVGADATGWAEVAGGFVMPSDLQLFGVGAQSAVLVFDGDVFAFLPEPGRKKLRGGDAPVAPRGAFAVALRDRRDCVNGGPCITLQLEGDGTPLLDFGDGTRSGCLDGTGFGAAPGRLFANGVEATIDSWADTRVCGRVSGELVDGLALLVHADGTESNRTPFTARSTLDAVDLPAELFPDTRLRARGKNLRAVKLPGLRLLSATDDELTFTPGAPAGTRLVLGMKGSRPVGVAIPFTVKPRLQHSCRSGPADLCTVMGVGLGAGDVDPAQLISLGFLATIAGQSAVLVGWSDNAVTMRWPAGLAPGVHPLVLTHPAGYSATAQVELVPAVSAPQVVADKAILSDLISGLTPRPLRTSRGLLVPVLKTDTLVASDGTLVPGSQQPFYASLGVSAPTPTTPHQVEYARLRDFGAALDGYSGIHLVEHGGALYAVGLVPGVPAGTAPTRARVVRLDPSPAVLGELTGPGALGIHVAGARVINGRLAVALSTIRADAGMHRTWLYDVVPGATSLTVSAPTAVNLSLGFSTISRDPLARGLDFGANGVWFSSCRNPLQPAEVHYLPITGGGASELQFGAPVPLVTATTRIISCGVRDDVFAWVERTGTTVEILYTSTLGAAPVPRVNLPATVPGRFQSWTYSADTGAAGVMDVEPLPNGDLVLLVNERLGPQRGVSLARWHAADASWSFSPGVLEPQTLVQPGELCVGPVDSVTVACPNWARWGCSPMACPALLPRLVSRPTSEIGQGSLVIEGTDAHLLYEVVETKVLPNVPGGRAELHYVRWPVPL